MNLKKEVRLSEISEKFRRINVKINNNFLKFMLVEASNSKKPHCNLEFIKKLGLKFTTEYSCYTVYAWTKYEQTIPLNKLVILSKLSKTNWQEIEKNILSFNAGSGTIFPKFPIKIDKRLGSIVGHIMGDGSIDKRYQQVFFSNSEKELLKEFSDSMKDIFGVNPRIWMQKAPEYGNTQWDKRLNHINELIDGRNGGLFYPTICGLVLNAIFGNFAIGKEKSITKEIRNSNTEFKKGFLRAFYDDESTVGKKSIRLFQDNKETLETIRNLLQEFNILPGKIKRYLKRDKERFYFDIFKKSNFLKFQNEIGFTSPQKSEKLRKLNIIIKPWNTK